MADRYDTTQSTEGQYQPGSENQVLRNRLRITDPESIEKLEFDLLVKLQERLLEEIEVTQTITEGDICEWHRLWLGEIYDWAGKYRTVNMSKGHFLFAASHLVPKLMQEFERDCLRRYTPCTRMDTEALYRALAVCHIEFILIHPFREGNGRLARVLATIMALQAGQPLLDFSVLEKNKELYIEAIHLGHTGDYLPMQKIFSEIVASSGM
ncbi:MAG: Fic family protein [Halioglobus sp.]|nr:Fic family protein [Halioglobus sp.]